MKRRLISLFLSLAVLLFLPISVLAAYPPLIDAAGILTDVEHDLLIEQCQSLRDTYNVDAVIYIADSLDGTSAQTAADDWYDTHNYGNDGVLFLLAMEEREWYISTSGYLINALPDSALEDIGYEVVPYLSDGAYFDGFTHFLSIVPYYLDLYQSDASAQVYYNAQGERYTVSPDAEPRVNFFLSLLAGAVLAGIVLLIMRTMMNSKNPRHSAEDYLNQGSYRLTRNQDLFLYSNVTKIPRPQQTSSGGGSTVHRSSSGRSHGGRGGKF